MSKIIYFIAENGKPLRTYDRRSDVITELLDICNYGFDMTVRGGKPHKFKSIIQLNAVRWYLLEGVELTFTNYKTTIVIGRHQ